MELQQVSYGALEADKESISFTKSRKWRRVGAVIFLMLGAVAFVGLKQHKSASLESLQTPDHSCPGWPAYCKEHDNCLNKFHHGDVSQPVDVSLCEDYVEDCHEYCDECQCPLAETHYCDSILKSCTKPGNYVSNGDVGEHDCPAGWAQVGVKGTAIVGCGLDKCEVGRFDMETVDECAVRCENYVDPDGGDVTCTAFTWTTTSEGSHPGRPVCTRYKSTAGKVYNDDPETVDLSKVLCRKLAGDTPDNVINKECKFSVHGAYFDQNNQNYPACPAGATIFGMAQGGFCCTGTCTAGEEGEGTDDVVCAIRGNKRRGATPECTDFQSDKVCTWAYDAGDAATFSDYIIKTRMIFEGEAAGIIFRAEEPVTATSKRYWLKFGHSTADTTANTVEVAYFDGTSEHLLAGDVSLTYVSGEVTSKPSQESLVADVDAAVQATIDAGGTLTAALGKYCVVENLPLEGYANKYSCPQGNGEAVRWSDNHPNGDTSAGACVNGKSELSDCNDYCASLASCNGFWYYDNGRCCPKNTWNDDFTRVIPEGGFYIVGGSRENIGYRITAEIIVPADLAGLWDFDMNIDFGWGGVIMVDGEESTKGYHAGDQWWAANYNRAMPQDEQIELTAGKHTIVFYGAEGCCDGSSNIMVTPPGETKRYLTKEALEDWKRGGSDPVPIELGRQYDVELRVEGSQFTLLLDGSEAFSVSDDNIQQGTVGFQTWQASMQASNLELQNLWGVPLSVFSAVYESRLATTMPYKFYVDGTEVIEGPAATGTDLEVPIYRTIFAIELDRPPLEEPQPLEEDSQGCAIVYPTGPPQVPVGTSCQRENGYCVLNSGYDQNTGVLKLNSDDGNTEAAQCDCLKQCQEVEGATGCEVIWDQGNRGCYVHTRTVARGNGVGRHYCWIFSQECREDGTTVQQPEPAAVAFAYAAQPKTDCVTPSAVCTDRIRAIQDGWATATDDEKAVYNRRGLTDENYADDEKVQKYLYDYSADTCPPLCGGTQMVVDVVSRANHGWKCTKSGSEPEADAEGNTWAMAAYDHSSWDAASEVTANDYSNLGPVPAAISQLAPSSDVMPQWLALTTGTADCSHAVEFNDVAVEASRVGSNAEKNAEGSLTGKGFYGTQVGDHSNNVCFEDIDLGGATALTVAMWVKFDDASSDIGWFSYGTWNWAPRPSGFMCQARIARSQQDIHCRAGQGKVPPQYNSVTNAVPDDAVVGTWGHLAISWDGSTLTYYVNGVNKGSRSAPIGTLPEDREFCVGGWPNDSAAKYLDGYIDLVRVWTSAKTDDEISALYASQADTTSNSGCKTYCVLKDEER